MGDAYLSTADYCAQRKPITGTWVFKDFYSAAGSSKNVKDTYFSSGIYTTPTAGAYHCCIEIRCKQGGYCDATLQKNGGTVIAATAHGIQASLLTDGPATAPVSL